jgi:hypothetical protein
MNQRVPLLIIGSLLLPLGCGGNDDPSGPAEPLVLEPSEFCSDHPDTAIATFEDANLEAAIRTALSVSAQEDLTCGLIYQLTGLWAFSLGITSLRGVQNLRNLRYLSLDGNSISDISALSGLANLTGLNLSSNSISDLGPLSGLTSLTSLSLGYNSISDLGPLSGLTNLPYVNLGHNSISDISALSGLTGLTSLHLDNNSISDISPLSGLTSLIYLNLDSNPNLSDIQPLLDNAGLGAGDMVNLESTSVSCTDVAALQAKGVTVESDCP